jgi:hypothetical protein
LLDILRKPSGSRNFQFPNREAAKDFALQVANTVYTYGLDGVDLDDEYAGYGNNGTGQPNNSSFVMLVQELKAAMPDKLVTFYYGPATTRQSYNGDQAGNYIDYSWNAMHGTYSAPNVHRLQKQSFLLRQPGYRTAIQGQLRPLHSQPGYQYKNDGYGVFMWYDLGGTNVANYLSTGSNILYNENTLLSGQLYSWSQDRP